MPREDFLIPKADGQVALTTNAIAYQIPNAADIQTTEACELIMYNNSTASINIRATTGTSSGYELIENAGLRLRLAPGQKVFGYSGVATQTLNYAIFVVG